MYTRRGRLEFRAEYYVLGSVGLEAACGSKRDKRYDSTGLLSDR